MCCASWWRRRDGRHMIFRPLLIALLILAIAGKSSAMTNEVSDETLLQLVLKRAFTNGGYIVVSPQSEGVSKECKAQVVKELKVQNGEVGELFDKLVKHNQKPVRLALKSSPKDGYLIDDGKYEKYFQKGGGGWERFYKEHPQAHGMTQVSLPVIDAKTGLVLIYYGNQYQGLAGAGWIILFKYEQGKLVELGRSMLWVS